MVAAIVEDLPPFPPTASEEPADYAAFDVAVRTKVLGGETVRVKVWARDGTIVYSDAAELMGQQFAIPIHAALAFENGQRTHISDLADPAHAFDRAHGELLEFYVAVGGPAIESIFVVEVEQTASGLNTALGQITRNVWLSIAIGLVAIGLVMAFGVTARGRELNHRRKQAEALLQSSFVAQEEERRRVVSALHDDIGQPMYRLLYGLEGARAQLDASHPVGDELERLAEVVRDMDTTLRRELRLLHIELAADAGISAALEELVELTKAETELDVNLTIELDYEPSAAHRTEMYRAAREAITNIRKHANARHVTVQLHSNDTTLLLDVVDDGTGIRGATDPGLGLSTTRQRFVALNGGVSLEAAPSGGTVFHAWLPHTEEGTS